MKIFNRNINFKLTKNVVILILLIILGMEIIKLLLRKKVTMNLKILIKINLFILTKLKKLVKIF